MTTKIDREFVALLIAIIVLSIYLTLTGGWPGLIDTILATLQTMWGIVVSAFDLVF
jgi:hypothetical protein